MPSVVMNRADDEFHGRVLRKLTAERVARAVYPLGARFALADGWEEVLRVSGRHLDAILTLCAEACPECDGTGTVERTVTAPSDCGGVEMDVEAACGECNGTGRVEG